MKIYFKTSVLDVFPGEYCKMGDKDGKQVLMCSWGKKIEPDLEFATRTDTVSPEQEEDKPYAVC